MCRFFCILSRYVNTTVNLAWVATFPLCGKCNNQQWIKLPSIQNLCCVKWLHVSAALRSHDQARLKQDRQFMHYVTSMRVRESLFPRSVRACGYLGAWACACAYLHVALLFHMQRVCAILWRHLWPRSFHHIFRHYLINGTIFGKKLLNIKCVLLFSVQLLSKHFSFWEEFSEILS